MEMRALRYLRAVAQEGSVSNAARALHMTQPTLSRQLTALEAELGCELFTRTHKGMGLNDQGAMLLRYAESILDLADKAREELSPPNALVTGTVRIGAGETMAMAYLAQAMSLTQERYPGVRFQLRSGASTDLADSFARGECDFLLECELRPHPDANVLELPLRDRWGVLVERSSPLAELRRVEPADLLGQPLLVPRQALANGTLAKWAGEALQAYDVRMEYNLPLNASLVARCGGGAQLTYEGLFEVGAGSQLAFVPLWPELASRQGLLWRRVPLSRQASAFLDALREVLAEEGESAAAREAPALP